jgi:hypothetical protein
MAIKNLSVYMNADCTYYIMYLFTQFMYETYVESSNILRSFEIFSLEFGAAGPTRIDVFLCCKQKHPGY